ncbi:MAG: InlB B-repeat-containing protein, partial [Actinomycetota bacterium]
KDASWSFGGWTWTGGAPSTNTCSGVTHPCAFAIDDNRTVTATFLKQYTLTATVVGSGKVEFDATPLAGPTQCVHSGAGSITCAPTTYDETTKVKVTPTADSGWSFGGWSGDCSGSGTCEITISGGMAVTATFKQQFDLTVTVVGSGSVALSPSPLFSGSNSCSHSGAGTTTCTAVSYDDGDSVQLTATPDAGGDWSFTGWTGSGIGACAGTTTNPCTFTLLGNTTVTATFLKQHDLTVTVEGSGAVNLSPSPLASGANACSRTGAGTTTCATVEYLGGTSVTLSAAPASTWRFDSWSGGTCSGTTSPCTFTIAGDVTVTATFIKTFAFSVATQPTNGTIYTWDPTASGGAGAIVPGIECGSEGSDCSELFDTGTNAYLIAVPDVGYAASIASWVDDSGACFDFSENTQDLTSICTLNTMDVDRELTTVEFASATYAITLTRTGTAGTVTSSPAGLTCGAGCASATLAGQAPNSTVTLTATTVLSAGARWRWSAWGGACASNASNTCALVMNGNKTVSVTFTQTWLLTVTSPTNATITSNISGYNSSGYSTGAVNCGTGGSVCQVWFDTGSTVVLTATGTGGATEYRVTGWSSAGGQSCTGGAASVTNGIGTCTLTMTAARNAALAAAPVKVQTLTISPEPAGGTVTSTAGLYSSAGNCGDAGDACVTYYDDATAVTLTATANSDHSFTGWSWTGGAKGTCTGTTSPCTFAIGADETVTATFKQQFEITVDRVGSGAITFGGATPLSGDSCPTVATTDCVATFNDGDVV